MWEELVRDVGKGQSKKVAYGQFPPVFVKVDNSSSDNDMIKSIIRK